MSISSGRDMRHVTRARALHARLYLNHEGRIFVVKGKVQHDPLYQTLARYDRCPGSAAAPRPCELGISGGGGELSAHGLHSIGRALHRWQKELAAESRRRPAQRRRASQIARELLEIERLRGRLAAIRKWQADLAAGNERTGGPFFLDPAEELELQTIINGAVSIHRLTPLVAWQARVVYWISGKRAAERFVTAVVTLLAAYPKVSCREQVRGFQRTAMVCKQRKNYERVRDLLAEIRWHIRRLPAQAVRAAKLSARQRNRSFEEHCDFLVARCGEFLRRAQLQRWRIIPAALAALTATDGSTVELPQRCFQEYAKQEDFSRILRTMNTLAAQRGRPGYDALLAAIDEFPTLPRESEFAWLCALLERTRSLTDAAWAYEQSLLHYLTDSFLNVPTVRRLNDRFAICGCPLSNLELIELVDSIERKEHLAYVHAWLAWLGSVSSRSVTPRIRAVLRAAFSRRYWPGVREQGWFRQLASLLAAQSRIKSSGDFAPLLDRIAAYRQLVGQQASMPKSLRRLLEWQQRRQSELEHLRRCHIDGTLSIAAQARLNYLSHGEPALANRAKLLRTAEELFLLFGVEALRAVTCHLAEAICRERLGDVFKHLSRDQFWSFAIWTNKMSVGETVRLREVIATRHLEGQLYKSQLPDNQAWIAKAVDRGVELNAWFAADTQVKIIADREMEVAVADDLHHIFLMGSYFDTCLSLGNGNQMSVLSNAYDANKQVVFLFDHDEMGRTQVIARQLIAISSDFKLLRYCCYLSSRLSEKAARQEAADAMATYCGQLAARCGLELADTGTPETIQDHFWYDDEAEPWSVAAKTARAESPNSALLVMAAGD